MAVESPTICQHPGDTVVEAGRPLAVLDLAPEPISERAHVAWTEGRDDLDDFRVAVLSVEPDAPIFALIAYRHDPQQATLVVGPPSATQADVRLLLRALGIEDTEVSDWADVSAPPSASLELLREAEELRQSTDLLKAVVAALLSTTDRLREEAAESLQTTLTAQPQSERQQQAWLVDAVRSAPIERLSPRQREVLLATIAGSSPAEIAAELGISPATVSSHLRAARNQLVHRGNR